MKRVLIPLMLVGSMALAGAYDTQKAQQPPQKVFTEVSLEQKLGSWPDLSLAFRDEHGQPTALRTLFRGKPVILALVYYECPMICTEVLNGMVKSFKHLPLDMGKDYDVVTISINPRETPELASTKKGKYLEQFGHPELADSWRFMTGEEAAIKALADSVGFHFVYDENTKQYAHPAGIMVMTPKGQVARYLYGVEYPPKDLKFALMEASENKVGSAVDQVLLLCYKYDPMTGKYGLIVMNLIRIGAVLTLLALGGTITFYLVRERRKQSARVANT
jgi:protein SCO1/2